VAGPPGNFEQTVEIDKGTEDGIKVGMPVVSAAGLVGKIVDVSDQRSIVGLISDPGFRVGVRLVDSQDVGVARGQGTGQPLIVDTGIDSKLDVKEGEVITTSGLERTLFPPDVPVGKVLSKQTSPGELEQDLFVQPLADLDGLSYVNVMLWEPAQ
jgi:rod shape-determining protein MreC